MPIEKEPSDHKKTQDDDLATSSPSIVPDRDDVELYQRQKAGKPKVAADPLLAGDDDEHEEAPVASGKLPVVLGVIAALALGWAGALQFQLSRAASDLEAWQMRVVDLEKRLSVTDESSTQSLAALQVKVKEQEEAVTRLRDESFKHAKATLDQHTSQLAALDQTLKSTQGTATKTAQAADEQRKLIDTAKAQLDQLAPTVELSKRRLEEQQAAIESVTEKGRFTSSVVEKLNLRMSTTEEWVQSINNFRKQTNREIVDIKQQISGPIKETPPK